MPSFLDRLKKEARFFFLRERFFLWWLVFFAGLVCCYFLISSMPMPLIRETDASFWIYWVAGMALLCFFGLLLFS